MDVDTLLKALENEDNNEIMNLNSDKIETQKINSLIDLELDDDIISDLLIKLKQYVYVSEIPDLKSGAFIRWIPLKNIIENDEVKLTKGAFVCDINICQKGTFIVCKNNFNTHMQVKMDDCLIYRKLNSQESVLLSAMNYLSK